MGMISRMLRVLAAILATIFGLWGLGALWFQTSWITNLKLGVGAMFLIIMLFAGISLLFRKATWRLLTLALASGLAMITWWIGILPKRENLWTAAVTHSPRTTTEGDRIVVHNVRNFAWSTEYEALERWEVRRYRHADLESLDLILPEHGSSEDIPAVLSFGFADGQRLALFSAVRKPTNEKFSHVAGLYKKYETAVLAADEADILKWLNNRRGNDLLLFRIEIPKDKIYGVFNHYSNRMNALFLNPEFYTPLTQNVFAETYKLAGELTSLYPTDWRAASPRDLIDHLYSARILAKDKSLDEIKEAAKIAAKARNADTAINFSSRIRE